MSILEHILSSRARAEIFRLLFGLEHRELHGRELARRSGLAIGTVRHELKNLENLDLIIARRDGNRLYYQANASHPLHREIHHLVLKTTGLVEVLQEALSGSDVDLAFVFGSIARDEEQAESDVDLMVVGRLGLRDLSSRLAPVSERIGREINPYILSVEEFIQRREKGEHFIVRVLESPRLFVIGTEYELEGMGKEQVVTPS